MKVLVTVAIETTGLPDADAKAMATTKMEMLGLTVEGTRIKRAPAEGKAFIPKPGKPGSTLSRGGRTFQVWADAPRPGYVWAIPTDPQPGEAKVFMLDTKYLTSEPRPYFTLGGYFTPAKSEMGLAA